MEAALADERDDLDGLADAEYDDRLQSRARIETGTRDAGERRLAGKAEGGSQPTAAAEELGAVGGPRRLPSGQVGEGDAGAERGAPAIACEHRPGLRVDLRGDEGRRHSARGAENPFRIGGDGKTAWPAERLVSVSREILSGSSSGT